MKKKLKSEAGVTLIELMLVLVILGILIILIYNTQLTGWRIWNFGQSRIQLRQQARLVISEITKEARRAETITITENNTKLKTEYNEQQIIYNLVEGRLLREVEESGTKEELASGVIDNGKLFIAGDKEEELSWNQLEINLKLERGSQEYQTRSRIYLRNKSQP